MQRLELLVLFIAALVVLAAVGLAVGRRDGHGHLRAQLLLGTAIGVTAALVILVLSVDLVPDQLEATVRPWVVAVVTVVMIGGLVLRIARR